MDGDALGHETLAGQLASAGLDRRATYLAHEVAEVGLRLRRATVPVESRLGWPALLPSGEPWPHAQGQRPLTFLAGISLRGLPFRGPLPEVGWLLFFVDLEIEDGGGLIDVAGNEPDSVVRVFYVPGSSEPVPAKPPSSLRHMLKPRPVQAIPQLTLPDDDEAPKRLGLERAEAEAYEDFTYALRYGEQGWSHSSGDHWTLGAWTNIQGYPSEADTVLLLHLAYDESLDFEFLDGGAIQFRIPQQALAAGDWSKVITEAESC